MKLGKRLSLVAAVALMAGLLPAFGAQAQSGSLCTLAASDCDLLTTAASNLSKETSFVQNFELSANIQGDQPGSFKITASGPFGAVAGASDPYSGFQFQADVAGSYSGSGSNGSFKVSLIGSGGVIYFSTDGKTWQGIKLSDLAAMGQQMGSMYSGSAGGAGSANASQYAQIFTDPAVLQSLTAIPNIKGFIVQTRTATDPTLDNQKMAEIVYTINPQPLLQSPDILPLVKAIVKAAAASGSPSTSGLSSMNDQQLQGLLQMASGSLGNTNLKITQWIGEDDKLYHAFGLDLNLDITPMGGSSKPVSGTIHFLLQLTKVGQAVSVTAPTGAKMIDPSQLMGGMMGGMMGGSSQ